MSTPDPSPNLTNLRLSLLQDVLHDYLDTEHVSYEYACSQAVLCVVTALVARRRYAGSLEAEEMLEGILRQIPTLRKQMLPRPRPLTAKEVYDRLLPKQHCPPASGLPAPRR